MSSLELFEAQLSAWGLAVDSGGVETLGSFAEVLAGYERANVIGTRDLDRVLLDHVLDSLSCLLFKPARDALEVADVGSGGGLPGVPLGIALPRASITLFESTGKKVDFLESAVRRLRLDNIVAVKTRVEDAGRERGHRAGYDLCTARAVARLSVVAEYCLPLVKVGGCVISMKGDPESREVEEGRKAAESLGGRVKDVIKVPFLREIGERERRLIVLEKVSPTPEKYPRKPGTPVKSPLGSR